MRSLDLNLASRPFRNNTLVWLGYAMLLAAAAGFTYWNVSSYRNYTNELARLDSDQGDMQADLADLRQRQTRVEQAVRKFDVKNIGRRTSKANEVIEWKAFSWTRLFNRLEEMLPHKVRMTSVRPIFRDRDRAAEDGDLRQSISVSVEGIARDLSAFHQIQTELISHGSFGYVLPKFADRTDNGEYSFGVDFLYYPDEFEPLEALPEEATVESDAGGPQVAAAAPAQAEARKPSPPDPKPAEVTDDWAEHAEPEPSKAVAEKPKAQPRRLPQVQPEEPDTAAPGQQGERP